MAFGAAGAGEMLVPFVTMGNVAGNRGHGGGGGGNDSVGAVQGRPGGGGGGVLEITCGTLTIKNGAAVRAAGGIPPDMIETGSAGGGGSGGAILVRVERTLSSSGTWLSAPGGVSMYGTPLGGTGGVGRIRVDSVANAASMTTEAVTAGGPMWDQEETEPIVAEPPTGMLHQFLLRGQSGRVFGVFVEAGPPGEDITVQSGGTMTPVTLVPGINRVCAYYATIAESGINGTLSEAVNCMSVAFMFQ
jgi:hypothetical protein